MKSRTSALAAAALLVLLAVSGCTAKSSSAGSDVAGSNGTAAGTQAFVSLQVSASKSDFAYYLHQQSEQLDGGVAEFADAYASGNADLAKALYAPTRVFYNRMLSVADAFPALDQSLDAQQSDLAPGQAFTGWHAIEADLYPASGQTPYTPEQRQTLAAQLVSDTDSVYQVVETLQPSVAQQTDGAAKLLQNRGTAAANGTEDTPSGSDLSDLQSYVDSAHTVFVGIRPLLVTQNAALATTLDHEFGAVQASLDAQRVGVSFPPYSQVSQGDLDSLRGKLASLTASLARISPALAPVMN